MLRSRSKASSRNATDAVMTLALIFFAAMYGVAYAYGTQYHTVNGVQHGCWASDDDYGCAQTSPSQTDYNKEGYNVCNDCDGDGDMDYSRVRIVSVAKGAELTAYICYNCTYRSAYYDTNPNYECKYKTRHYTTGPYLGTNDHYTRSALC